MIKFHFPFPYFSYFFFFHHSEYDEEILISVKNWGYYNIHHLINGKKILKFLSVIDSL